jgi:hypothetical protein
VIGPIELGRTPLVATFPHSMADVRAARTKEKIGHPGKRHTGHKRRVPIGMTEKKKREESFVPVEITGAWVRAEKGIGGRIVLGVVCAGAEAPAS